MKLDRWIPAAAALALLLSACGEQSATEPKPEPPPPAPDTVASPAMEARAIWVSRFDWTDQAELTALIRSIADANFNIVYFQARGRADAYYRSSLEPWAERPPAFRLGQDPGWDPLAVALTTAKANGLQLHVWINALIGWCGSSAIPETTPRHVLLQHPDWKMLTQAGSPTNVEGCTFLTPGAEGVRAWLGAVSADIVRRYAVDGIHLDYIRYPDATMSYDAHSVAAYDARRQTAPWLTFDDFRRDLVTATVRTVRDSIRAVRSSAVLSAAVWGVYKNTAGWANVSTGYDTRLQDSRGWLEAGIIDVINPMVYWPIDATYGDRLDFAWLADDFAKYAFNRHVYVGMGIDASPGENFCAGCDVVKQIYRARKAAPQGITVYNARLARDKNLFSAIRAGPFKAKVPVPPMPWK